MSSKIKLTAFENASILRKLTILYFLMSIIPVCFLYYLYSQIHDNGHLEITEENFRITLILVVIGVGVGYVAMRSMIIRIIDISRTNRQAMEHLLGPDQVRSFSSGNSNEIAVLAKSFNEITSRLEENVRNLELAKKTLHSVLARVGEGISSMENIDNFLNLILETVTDAIQAELGLLLLKDEKKGDFYIKASYGKSLDEKKNFRCDSQHELIREAVNTKQSVIIDRLAVDKSGAGFFVFPLVCAPLVLHDKVLGVLLVSGRKTAALFTDDEKRLLYNLALQTAVAIENSRLNADAEKTYFETISALALAVEAKDPYSRGHLDRVARLVVDIGKILKLDQEELRILRDAARLHDLGKIGVTDTVLTKEGSLTPQEMEMMKKHCEIGEGIIKPIRSLRNLCDLVRHHHEKLDGSGYPDGLRGEQIKPLVRILTVADIYDALTTKRSYRDPFARQKALDELRLMKDKLDQRMVDALEQVTAGY